MAKKPKCRIKVTLKCNRRCKFCINKNKKYRARWKHVNSLLNIDYSKYRTIIISGGEPTTLNVYDLKDMCRRIRLSTPIPVPIYLQTNGYQLTKSLVSSIDNDIDGIGLSIYDRDDLDHYLTRWTDILKIKPIRLYMQNTFYDKLGMITRHNLAMIGFTFRVWQEDEFDKTEEIYVLDE